MIFSPRLERSCMQIHPKFKYFRFGCLSLTKPVAEDTVDTQHNTDQWNQDGDNKG